jgi:hypothetical protein
LVHHVTSGLYKVKEETTLKILCMKDGTLSVC